SFVKDLQARIHQLGADRDRHSAADQAGHEREHQVHRADVLVIGGIKKAPPAVRDFVRFPIAVRGVCHRIHCQFLRVCDRYRAAEVSAAATALCAALLSLPYFCFALLSQVSKSFWFTTRTAIGIKAWSLPHSSEHWP